MALLLTNPCAHRTRQGFWVLFFLLYLLLFLLLLVKVHEGIITLTISALHQIRMTYETSEDNRGIVMGFSVLAHFLSLLSFLLFFILFLFWFCFVSYFLVLARPLSRVPIL